MTTLRHGLRPSSTHAAGLRTTASDTNHRMRDGNDVRILFLFTTGAVAAWPFAGDVGGCRDDGLI